MPRSERPGAPSPGSAPGSPWPAARCVALTGDHLGKVITQVQPMKMAAAEALYATTTGAPFSHLRRRRSADEEPFFSLEIPYLLSILAKGDPNATVQGIDDLQAQYTAQYGPGNYVPMIPVAFWTFRLMIGVGMLAAAASRSSSSGSPARAATSTAATGSTGC